MVIIPAIDIKNGKCIRIERGDPSKVVFSSDMSPVDIALEFEKKGAKRLHIVDLSAVFGEGSEIKTIKEIVKSISIPIQVGGGIRSRKVLIEYLSMGVNPIISTNTDIADIDRERIILGLDFDEELNVLVKGWIEKSGKKVYDFKDTNFFAFIFTATYLDGTMEGIEKAKKNFEKIAKIFEGKKIIAAGGITNEKDLDFLKSLNFWGVVVGRAIYSSKEFQKLVFEKQFEF